MALSYARHAKCITQTRVRMFAQRHTYTHTHTYTCAHFNAIRRAFDYTFNRRALAIMHAYHIVIVRECVCVTAFVFDTRQRSHASSYLIFSLFVVSPARCCCDSTRTLERAISCSSVCVVFTNTLGITTHTCQKACGVRIFSEKI